MSMLARSLQPLHSCDGRGEARCASRGAPVTLVVVDAENVRRSLWPNLSPEELVDRVRAWARAEGHEALIVFDRGRWPGEAAPDVVAAPGSADDEIAALSERIEGPFWLVTSDRGLRERVGDRAERVLGGGSFVRSI
jgi:hypothetical protein